MLIARRTHLVSASDCFVEELTCIEDLERIQSDWDNLARQCAEQNIFYESLMLLPALRYLLTPTELDACRFYLVWSSRSEQNQLLGFFPFMESGSYHGIPLRHLTSLSYCHCYLNSPLLRIGSESRCWEAFLAHVAQKGELSFFRLSAVSGEGPSYNEAIKTAKLAGQHVVETDNHVRACMRPTSSFSEYLRIHVSRKVTKEIRRKLRRISEFGKVDFHVMNEEDSATDWVMEFMELEAKGWKGRKNVAIVNSVGHMKFLREVCKQAHQERRLHVVKITLDSHAIAMKCAFQSGPTLFAFKIAYDEDYAQCSPGQLLEFEHLQWLCNQSEIRWVDSCMKPDDFMISRLWKDSRMIRFVNISCGGDVSRVMISLVPFVKRMRDTLLRRK